ncbi:hypothetical protein [Selenomonas sp. AE3005]|uniref:hypothetical protein n=1 Tax=Selenomonas sp. AE3005 TaxID=1485543 RepID=UPI000483A054|nr:hypothetical protein [Selenomonas sp. AE3005]
MSTTAYTRQYPNTFTSSGTTVLQGFKNDDAEIRRILSLLDAMTGGGNIEESGGGGGGGSSVNRNSIINAEVTPTGLLDCFITDEKNTVGIHAETPIILSFASGFAGKTPRDFITVINETNPKAWQNLPYTETVYLYAEYNVSTRIVSFNFTTFEDTYSYVEPAAPKAGQCWYDMKAQQMKLFDGQVWQNTRRIFFAQAMTNGAGTVTIKPYSIVSRPRAAELSELLKTNPEILYTLKSRMINADTADVARKLTAKAIEGESIFAKSSVTAEESVNTKKVDTTDIVSKTARADTITGLTVNASGLNAGFAAVERLEVTKEELTADKGATIRGTLNAADLKAKTFEVESSSNLHGTTMMNDASAASLETASLKVTDTTQVSSLNVAKDTEIKGDLLVSGKIRCSDIPVCRIPYADEIDRYHDTNCNIYISEYDE